MNREDFDFFPAIKGFRGRSDELPLFKRWIVDEQCTLIGVFGIGGIGKTIFTAKLANDIKSNFDYFFWRSLRTSPQLDSILEDSIRFFSDQKEGILPTGLDARLSLLLRYLQNKHSLIVLDNFESILKPRDLTGAYKNGFEGYGELLRQFSSTEHQGLMIITSREIPKEFLPEGRGKELSGLQKKDIEKILKVKGRPISGSNDGWAKLLKAYSGNPLYLILIAGDIRNDFEGNIDRFLEANTSLFISNSLLNPLDQQFNRLSSEERGAIYWLAIEREPVHIESLERNSYGISQLNWELLLKSLRDRFFVEYHEMCYGLQNVILEYVTDRLINEIYYELIEDIDQKRLVKRLYSYTINTHALIKTDSKDYVRQSQINLILRVILNRLLGELGELNLRKKLEMIFMASRHHTNRQLGYVVGNAINMLVLLDSSLNKLDLSGVFIRQAYFRGVNLYDVDFTDAEFRDCVFTETFGRLLTVAFNPEGNLLAAGGANGQISLWDILKDKQLYVFNDHTNWVWKVKFSPDGHLLASGSADTTIRLWDISSGRCLSILYGHSKRIRAIAFSTDGKYLASAGEDEDHGIRIWNLETEQCVRVLIGHNGWIRDLFFSSNQISLASASDDGTVRIWNWISGSCTEILSGHKGQVATITFSADGKYLASGGEDRVIRLWNIKTHRYERILEGHSEQIRGVDFSHDSKLLISAGVDRTLRLWNIRTGKCVRTFQGHSNQIRDVVFSTKGTLFASASEDQTVRLWDSKTSQSIRTLRGYTNWVWAIAYSPKSKLMASAHEDGAIRLWDLRYGNLIKSICASSNQICGVAFHPNGKVFAGAGGDEIIRIWELKSGNLVSNLRGHTNWIWHVSFSPDGRLLASSGGDKTIRLWDVKSNRCVRILRGHASRVWKVVFSPDGQELASSGDDNTVRLWSICSGRCFAKLRGHTESVWGLAFSNDGRLIASGSNDNSIRIWDTETRKCIQQFTAHSPRVNVLRRETTHDLVHAHPVGRQLRRIDVDGDLAGRVADELRLGDTRDALEAGASPCGPRTWSIRAARASSTGSRSRRPASR